MLLLSKNCPRCKKRAKKDPDGFSCITCGWTEYIVIETPKEGRGRVPYLDRFFIPYRGFNPEYRRTSAIIMTLLYQTKKNLDKIFYFMYCPVDDCNERTLGKRTWQFSLRDKNENYFKFLCKDKHLWYLVVLKGEPLHWLSQDLEINNAKSDYKKKSSKKKTHTPKSIQEIPKRR